MGADEQRPFVSADLVDRLARLDVDALERLARLDTTALERAVAGAQPPSPSPDPPPSSAAASDPLTALGAAMTAAFETISRSVEGLVAATARLGEQAAAPAPAPRRRRPAQQPPDEPDEPDDPDPSPASSSVSDGLEIPQRSILSRMIGDVPRVNG